MNPPLVVDTGSEGDGYPLTPRTPRGGASFPKYEAALTPASRVVVPAPLLAEVDSFLREDRAATGKLAAEVFDPGTRYEYEFPLPTDIVRALEPDARSRDLAMGLADGRWRRLPSGGRSIAS